jgi:hypothetical protein
MTYGEFQRHIGKAGLKLNEFARLMDMHPNTMTNKRKVGVPRTLATVAVLIGDLADRGVDLGDYSCATGSHR